MKVFGRAMAGKAKRCVRRQTHARQKHWESRDQRVTVVGDQRGLFRRREEQAPKELLFSFLLELLMLCVGHNVEKCFRLRASLDPSNVTHTPRPKPQVRM